MSRRRHPLTDAQVRALRELAHQRGWSARRLARARRLPARTVQHLLVGTTFPDAGGPIRRRRRSRRVLTAADARRIRKLRDRRSSPDLANEYGCSPALIRHIWTGRCHA